MQGQLLTALTPAGLQRGIIKQKINLMVFNMEIQPGALPQVLHGVFGILHNRCLFFIFFKRKEYILCLTDYYYSLP